MEIQNEATEKPAKEKPPHVVVKNTADYQRLKLERLMKNPDKPVLIPERPKERGSPHVPDFVRNVMGSSAGAGSGEFHVYRHLRRKEYARQKYMQERAAKEKEDEAYRKKLEENKKLADERTAKKRAKRLKKKKKQKSAAKKPKLSSKESSSDSEDSSEDDSTAYGEHETSQDDERYSGTENERNKIPDVSEMVLTGKALQGDDMNSAPESGDNQGSEISDTRVNEACAQKSLENENTTGESQDDEMSAEKSRSDANGHIDEDKNQ